MASTYFDSATEIQPVDGLQTLYLMNPSYALPTPQQSNFIFLNSPLINSQHLVSIPLQQYQPQDSIDFQSQMGWSSVPAQQGLSLSLSATKNDDGANGVAGSNKYLKAAQQLLDEVVNVKNEQIIGRGETAVREKERKHNLEGGGGQTKGGGGGDLTEAERQEVQMKKAKLVNMLAEVEQRYRKYQQQMQIVVSSFEAVAGLGSARAYTALALKTISKQFCCLRDAISDRIRATSNRLGEKEDEDRLDAEQGKKSTGSRLRWVDHQLRQQRSLQQLGMTMQVHNVWRPQRGLPERSVSVLRTWLFEHFLHPYPKDSDKHMLAKQTGLTRSQVSNWFINARVRLWKPMVEEMYLEETKQQDHNNGDNDKTSKSESSEQPAHNSNSHQPNSSTPPRSNQNQGLHSIQDYGMMENHSNESILQQRLKKAREDISFNQNTISNQMSMEINEMRSDELTNRELLMKLMDQGGGFGGYPIEEIARFDHHEQFTPRFGRNGGGVSLTLGLPHCENLSDESIPLGSNYFSLDNNNINNRSASNHPNGYESFNIQNRKRFAGQLLPDYIPLEL